MEKRSFLASELLDMLTTACTTTSNSSGDPAAQRRSIDSSVDAALSKLHGQAQGSRELTAKAKGVLVFHLIRGDHS